MGTRLGAAGGPGPKGFLRLGGRPIVEQAIDRLRRAGIGQVVVVTGYKAGWYEDLARYYDGLVTTIHNPLFERSGSMYSLSCARDRIDSDFLLLESDLVFEQRALSAVLDCPERDCILASTLTGSHDEVFIETDGDRLVAMAKDRGRLGSVSGELVGITKVSTTLYAHMLRHAQSQFANDLNVDYETDCMVAVARRYAVHCHPALELAWAEIDDAAHLERAKAHVYPEILRRDGLADG